MMYDDDFKNIKKLLLVLTFYSLFLALGFWCLEIKLSRRFKSL